MKRIILALTLVTTFGITAQAQFKDLLNKAKEKVETISPGGDLSTDQIGKGLKEALDKGVGKAVDFLSAKDGYLGSKYKINMPDDAKKVTDKLKMVPGWDGVEQKLELKMNRAAEAAAIKAKPIFIKAIKDMSFKDATNILMGEKDAATTYLKKSTYTSLFDTFMPIIQSALDEVNARSYWKGAVSTYNKLPFVKKANPELDKYVTDKALVAMFALITEKEKDIRQNTGARKSELLKKVFAKQD